MTRTTPELAPSPNFTTTNERTAGSPYDLTHGPNTRRIFSRIGFHYRPSFPEVETRFCHDPSILVLFVKRDIHGWSIPHIWRCHTRPFQFSVHPI
ncbi:hypothetical protein AVEN_186529-1 [Araneus ventricosus]|uniref:Uncharacterized protein n=1 Tax=Araneus ventricosus TaxID=182803 RepID=A0A4Y2RCC9_ARAVE|nr:hypothetical protein AVEN_186529-1 [Araneus ventricosus]